LEILFTISNSVFSVNINVSCNLNSHL